MPARATEIMAQAEVDRSAGHEAAPPASPGQWLLGLAGFPVRVDGKGVVYAPVTLALAAAMVIATVAGYFYGLDAAIDRFGLVPAEPERLGGLTLLTSFLLHGGVFHLVGNLYFLMVIGSAVEERIGSRRTAIVLAASLATAALTHMAFDPRPGVPLVGASGGIAALFTLFVLAYARVPFRMFLFIPIPPVMRWIKVSATALGSIFLAYNLIGLWYQLGGWSDISSLAHLGGAAAGIVFWLAWRGELKVARRVAEVTRVKQRAISY